MIISKILLFLILIISLQAKSLKDTSYGSVLLNEVTSIYDGDTFRANIDSFPSLIGKRMSIRINGIDTPEMRAKCSKEKNLARRAKQFSVSALRGAKVIELRDMKRGKYFRIVADVFVDSKSLGSMLIDKGFAVPYDGGTKTKDWCK
ncbi:MAG: thermonuclease family protein [Campylobacterota bacterium]|nr:thermonuclease family protein [Campylobacterota bacterium]